MTIKVVCFDFDGTIISTTNLYGKIPKLLRENYKNLGVPEELLDCENDTVYMLLSSLQWIAYNKGKKSYDYAIEVLNECLLTAELNNIINATPTCNLPQLFEKIQSQGVKIAIISHNLHSRIISTLKSLRIDKYVEKTIGRDDLDFLSLKPMHQTMVEIESHFNVVPEQIIMVGDYKYDYYLAKNSGTNFMGVCTGLYSRKDWEKYPDADLSEDITGVLTRL